MHSTDRIVHSLAFVKPVVEHYNKEREIEREREKRERERERERERRQVFVFTACIKYSIQSQSIFSQ